MKKRNPAAVLLLPFVTLGIYMVYWLYATRKEIVARNNNPNSIPPVIVLFAPVLLLIALFFAIIMIAWNDDGTAANNLLIMFLAIIGFAAIAIVPLWWFWRYCKTVAETTRGMDATQLYVLYVVISWLCTLPSVWMLITQMEFNKLIEAEEAAPHHAGGHHPRTTETHDHTKHPHHPAEV
jgi:hypothetical protein